MKFKTKNIDEAYDPDKIYYEDDMLSCLKNAGLSDFDIESNETSHSMRH